jgi:hypothetical protein
VSAELPKLPLLLALLSPFPPPARPPEDEDAFALEALVVVLILVIRGHGEADPERGPANTEGSGIDISGLGRLLRRKAGWVCGANDVGCGCCKFGSAGDFLEGLVDDESEALVAEAGRISKVSREPAPGIKDSNDGTEALRSRANQPPPTTDSCKILGSS